MVSWTKIAPKATSSSSPRPASIGRVKSELTTQRPLVPLVRPLLLALAGDRNSAVELLDSARKHSSDWIVDETLRASVLNELDGVQLVGGL